MGKKLKGHGSFYYCSVVNVFKVWRQKDMCIGKNCLVAIGEQEREN